MSRARDLYSRISIGGYNVVIEMIANRETEELFLDYKRSANNGNGNSLDNSDKSSLSKAISGFANSEGGVIVWGVDCRMDRANPGAGDVPQSAIPITNVVRFKSLLENAVSGTTIPAHDGVQHAALAGPNGVDGFVVSLIPKGSHPPYQTLPDLTFKMRAGSNFTSVPRSVLAGMFGQFPQPEIVTQFVVNTNPRKGVDSISYEIGFALRNAGQGIGSDVYLNLFVYSSGGEESEVAFEISDKHNWTHSFALSRMWTSMLKSDQRMAPEGLMIPVSMNVTLREPINQDLKLTVSSGAKGSVSTKATLHVPAEELAQLFAQASEMHAAGQQDFGATLADRLLRVNDFQD